MLLFIDNIFRFTQAGSEVSALLGRIPSAVGYQPTLATEMGHLQERITSTNKGSITSVQAIYVPADDLTDPAPATSFAHLDATTVLSRDIAAQGIFPAVDPLDSTSRILDPLVIGEEHYTVARRVQEMPAAVQGAEGHHRHPGHGRAVGRRQAGRGPRPQDQRFLSQPFYVAEEFTNSPGKFVELADTIRIVQGDVRRRVRPSARGRLLHGRHHRRGGREGQASGRRGGVRAENMATFHFELVSPERLVFSGAVTQVDVPGEEGDFGVFAGHAPYVATLKPGVLTIYGDGAPSESWCAVALPKRAPPA